MKQTIIFKALLLFPFTNIFAKTNSNKENRMTITVTKTINIKAEPNKVWDYVNDL